MPISPCTIREVLIREFHQRRNFLVLMHRGLFRAIMSLNVSVSLCIVFFEKVQSSRSDGTQISSPHFVSAQNILSLEGASGEPSLFSMFMYVYFFSISSFVMQHEGFYDIHNGTRCIGIVLIFILLDCFRICQP